MCWSVYHLGAFALGLLLVSGADFLYDLLNVAHLRVIGQLMDDYANCRQRENEIFVPCCANNHGAKFLLRLFSVNT
jgi:hypothetical protein